MIFFRLMWAVFTAKTYGIGDELPKGKSLTDYGSLEDEIRKNIVEVLK